MKTETFTYVGGRITQQLSPWGFEVVFAGIDPFQLHTPCWAANPIWWSYRLKQERAA